MRHVHGLACATCLAFVPLIPALCAAVKGVPAKSSTALVWGLVVGGITVLVAAAAAVALYRRRQKVYSLLSPPSSRNNSEQA